MESLPERADVVVVGAGPAGAAVAQRLAADGREVLVIEAGRGGPRPPSLAGLDLVAASEEVDRLWPGLEARDAVDGPARPYRQGRGLGGGSMVNGMLLTPGDRVDYRQWAEERGCVEWGPEAMAPWLETALDHYPTRAVEPGPVSQAVARAAAEDGVAVGGTSLDADRLGVLEARLSAVGERRWSSADADLDGDGVAGPDGVSCRRLTGRAITVATGDGVDRLVPRRTGGVEVLLGSGSVVVASKVVVCAGALATPTILARSALVADGPGGRPLRDHPSYAFTLILRDEVAGRSDLRHCPPVVSTLIRWSSGPAWPGDLQAIVIDRVRPSGWTGPTLAVVAVGLMAVTSTGSVATGGWSRSPSGHGRPEVVTGALGTEVDRVRLRAGVRRVARWLGSAAVGAMAGEVHLDDRGTPLAAIDRCTDDDLDQLIASRSGPYTHPAASCPMGPEGAPGVLTGSEPGRFGQLDGVPDIRLADVSIFPDLVRGGLQLPAVAVANRVAADLVAAG